MKSAWEDCKTSKIAFKTIKFLTNDEYDSYETQPKLDWVKFGKSNN